VHRRSLWALAPVALALLAAAAPAGAQRFVDGSPGLGDPFFPLAGNGGYDVRHYSLDLSYERASGRLDGAAAIKARAKQDLRRFDLDLRGFDVSKLTVNGRRAAFGRDGQELVIRPRQKLRKGDRFRVKVRYGGVPEVITDPDESVEGWVPTDDGAFVVGEPQGSPGWYPANDNPRDKATYDFAITVPAGFTAVANGVLRSHRTRGGRTTWRWRESLAMAPYLATATNGNFALATSRTSKGIPIYNAIDPRESAAAAPVVAKLPEVVDFFSSIYGRYPFDAVGSIVDHAPDVGYALESQTKPNYDRAPDEETLVHELSHMWYGDAVTLRKWPDIWLHEGFATWSEWIWSEHQGEQTAQQRFDELYARPASDDAFWNPPPGDPGGPENLFDGTVYNRGAMTLQALRQKVGDADFFRIMRRWYARNRYGNVDTRGFIRLAERVSGRRLDRFFDVWLYRPGKPARW
jgi:aminopeptidase N